MILFIVESPTKCKTIQNYLGKDYIVVATCGHFMELDPKSLSVDISTWTPTFIPSKDNVIANIKKLNKKCKTVYISTDDDMEGTGIGYHIKNIVDGDVYRVTYNEITKPAIMKGIENKHELNMDIVNAYLTRRMIDRVTGYSISPILWKQFNDNHLSAGRVQSCVLAILLQKQYETNNKDVSVIWDVIGNFEDGYINTFHKKVDTKNEVIDILKSITFKHPWDVSYDVIDHVSNPPPPFITSTIQIAFSSMFHISNKGTMDILQTLFEKGLITYHRTSYLTISPIFKKTVKTKIGQLYGEKYFKSRYGTNDTNSAHECIRVTDINDDIGKSLDNSLHKKVYYAIWKRTIQSLMIPAVYDRYNIKIEKGDIVFTTKRDILKEPGYMIIDEKDFKKQEISIPSKLMLLEVIGDPKTDVQLSYYNEGTIIKKMETCGVGRPSTYAPTITNIMNKGYVEYSKNPEREMETVKFIRDKNRLYQEKIIVNGCLKGTDKMLHVTRIGEEIIKFLDKNCNFLLSSKLTSDMENNLDMIEQKKIEYKNVLSVYYRQIEVFLDRCQDIVPTPLIKDDELSIYTRYGRCIKHDNKFINIEGFLKFLKIEKINDSHYDFLIKLPILVGEDKYIYNGKYGLYFKCKNSNLRINKDQLKHIKEMYNL